VNATTEAPLILRARRRRATAWKNGGGLTREIVAAPAGADLSHFDWRVSTAEVRRAGPFSSFPGVTRTLCVLAGELVLAVEGSAEVRLSPQSAPLQFAADVPAHAEPVGGAVTDLNVMTRRTRFAAQLTRLEVGSSPLALHAQTTLIFALADLALSAAGAPFTLSRWDAARFSGAAQCTVTGASGSSSVGAFYLIEISAARSSR
jgi:uncharacterized protein